MRHLAFLLVLSLIPVAAFGQALTTGRIVGTVVDEDGQPVANARVNVLSPVLQGERVIRADDSGRFQAELLPSGPYSVTIASPGKQTVQISLRVGLGQMAPLNVTLKAGKTEQERVTVYATATPLETTVIGENFGYDTRVEELPIPDREIEEMVLLGPNANSVPSRHPHYISITGAAPNESAFLLDGAEITDNLRFLVPTLYVEDAIDEVQVQTAGVSARYGRFMGGVINAVTNTGGNEIDGTFRAQFTNESWNSRTPFGEEVSDTVNQVYQATLGGFILKNHLWFFLSGLTRPTDTVSGETRDTLDGFSSEIDELRWQAKLRGAVTPNHIIDVNHLEYELNIDGTSPRDFCCTPGDTLATNGRGSFPRQITTLAYQGILGPKTFVEFLASRKEVSSARGGDPSGGSPFVDISADRNNPDTYVGFHNNALDPRDAVFRDNESLGFSATRLLSTEKAGSHRLEGGIQYVNSLAGGAGRYSVTNYTFGFALGATPFVEVDPVTGDVRFNVNSADQVNLRIEDLLFSSEQEIQNYAVYAHDTWGIGKWRVDLGLRWEKYRTAMDDGSLDLDVDALAPRAALTYSIKSRWQVQASYGKYVGRLDDSLIGNQTGIASSPAIQSVYVGPAFDQVDYDEVETIVREDAHWFPIGINDPETPTAFISEDAELPYSLDFNLSLKWGLPGNRGSATVSYINRDYRNIWDGFVGGQGVQTVPVPGRPDPLPFDTTIWTDTTQAKRTYEAIVLEGDYRPGPRWEIGGNWTYSELEGNTETFDFTFGGFGSAIGAYPRSRPEANAVPEGSLVDDIRHRLNVWTSYRFDLGRAGALVLGGLGRYRSGMTWSRIATAEFSADPEGEYVNAAGSPYTFFFDGRGNNEFDDWWSVDVSARYQFSIFKALQGWVKATVTNVFDNSALVQFDTSGIGDYNDPANPQWTPSPTFGEVRGPEDYQTPRLYQFTVGLVF